MGLAFLKKGNINPKRLNVSGKVSKTTSNLIPVVFFECHRASTHSSTGVEACHCHHVFPSQCVEIIWDVGLQEDLTMTIVHYHW